MGFLDFLKKDKELQFKSDFNTNSQGAKKSGLDPFNEVPAPPKDFSPNSWDAKSTNNSWTTNSSTSTSSNTTTQSTQNSWSQAAAPMPQASKEMKDVVVSQKQTAPANDIPVYDSQDSDPFSIDRSTPRQEFVEQPISPEEFGQEEEFDWAHVNPFEDNTQKNTSQSMSSTDTTSQMSTTNITNNTTNIYETTYQNNESSSNSESDLPDLPELPEDAMNNSLGVHEEQDEIPQAPKDAFKAQSERIDAKEESKPTWPVLNINEQKNNYAANTTTDSQDANDSTTYLREEKDVEKEFYVESHTFYETLQEIKATKRLLRECDETVRGWEDLDDKAQKKSMTLMDTIDQVQEDLMKIDAVLFER